MKKILRRSILISILTVIFVGSVRADVVYEGDAGISSDGVIAKVYAGRSNGSLGSLYIDNGSQLTATGYIAIRQNAKGTVTVDGVGSKWGTGYLYLGSSDQYYIGPCGKAYLNIVNGGSVNSAQTYAAKAPFSSSTIRVDGVGSQWNNSGSLSVGGDGKGQVDILNGGVVNIGNPVQRGQPYIPCGVVISQGSNLTINGIGSALNFIDYYDSSFSIAGSLHIIAGAKASCDSIGIGGFGDCVVDGIGSALVAESLSIDSRKLNIINGGTVIADSININGNAETAFVNIDEAGRLALLGNAEGSIDDFLGFVDGLKNVHFWDDDIEDWNNITNGIRGEDYTLVYFESGELAGYTVLTVPEPATICLLAFGGIIFKKRT